MNSKNKASDFSPRLIHLAIFIIFPLYSFGVDFKEPKVKDGIYYGKFQNSPMFYRVDSSQIRTMGFCFPILGIQVIDEESFFVLLSKSYFQKFLMVEKIPISKKDCSKAKINSDKEFLGFHSGPLLGDPEYQVGILLAIKDLENNKFLITLYNVAEDTYFQTEGKMSTEQYPIFHRKLSFKVKSEINKFKDETWDITLNPITNYVWQGMFNVYINNKWRFETEVIEN